jgi:hypothetical protein
MLNYYADKEKIKKANSKKNKTISSDEIKKDI